MSGAFWHPASGVWKPEGLPPGFIPLSPPAEARAKRKKILDKELHYPISGKVLCPGMKGYDEVVQAIGIGIFAPGLANVRREGNATQGAGSGGPVITAPTAFWRFEETTGSATWVDSASSNDLTATGSVTGATGKIGGDAEIFSATKYLSISDNAALSGGDRDFMFVGWIYTTIFIGLSCIFGKDDVGAGREYNIFSNSGPGELQWGVFAAGGDAAVGIAWPAASTWHFFVCWHDSVGNQIGFNLNNGTPVTTGHTFGVRDGGVAFTIGCIGAGIFPWNGRVDAFGRLNGLWSGTEQTSIYNSGNGREYYSGAWH